ncbi:hypothetical protein COL79_07595, partial [Bacillus pseudomycoides]
RSSQILFLPHAKLKQREKTSPGHLLFFIAATYMLANQNGTTIYHSYIVVPFKSLLDYIVDMMAISPA